MAFTTISGSAGTATTLSGTAGIDSVAINADFTSNLFVGAQKAADTVSLAGSAARSAFTIKGGQGTDTISFGGSSLDKSFLNGNSDSDTFGSATDEAVLTNSTLQGGRGTDSIFLNSATNSIVNGNKEADTIGITGTISSASVRGGANNDTITVGNVANLVNSLVNGDKGNDTITISLQGGQEGSQTNSTVQGGEGNDTLNGATATAALLMAGGAGNDNVSGSTTGDTLNGGAGNDTIQGNTGADQLSGADGNDQFVYALDTDLFNAANDFVDIINGGGGIDSIVIANNGQGGVNAAFTLVANDVFDGSRDSGIEQILSRATNRNINLTLSAASAASVLNTIDLSGDTDATDGAGGTSENTINVTAAAQANAFTLRGGAGSEAITGGAGGDTISGGGGINGLVGGAGSDTISGGGVADSITGGTGADTMTGGAGADEFIYAAGDADGRTIGTADIITDYATTADIITSNGGTNISLMANVDANGNAVAAAATAASITAAGLAGFAAADDTFAERLTAVAGGLTASATAEAAGQAVLFNGGTSNFTYLFISDGQAGLGANDYLARLDGVGSANGITVANNEITAIS